MFISDLPTVFPDLVGKQFGKLTVVGLNLPKIKGRSKSWKCKCQCGKFVNREEKKLLRVTTVIQACRSCSAAVNINNTVRPPPGEPTWKLLLYRYIKSASKKGVEFSLSEELFRQICSQNCTYCNTEPRIHNKYRLRKSGKIIMNVSDDAVRAADVYANGIDRVDSSKGYVSYNCVPCCHVCNYAKQSMTQEQFLCPYKKSIRISKSSESQYNELHINRF